MTKLKKLTTIEKARLIKFQNLTYSDKEKLKVNNLKRYENLILLQERFHESQIVITHQKYRNESSVYNQEITKSINPSFFITIKYIDKIAFSHERVESMFVNIKHYITQDKDYKFQHHIEKGLDSSYHSHLFVSSIKNKTKQTQISWLNKQLNDYRKLNKFSIANGYDSIDVRLFNQKELNLSPSLRTNYISKSDNRQYLSLDISPNTNNPYAD